MLRRLRLFPLALLLCPPLRAEEATAKLRFEVSFPASVRAEAADGRVYVILTRKPEPEPRLQFGALEWPSGKIDQELQVFATSEAIEIPALGWTFERKP